MKHIIILICSVICTFSVSGQTNSEEGDFCFDIGNYPCAVSSYEKIFNNAKGKERQFAEINLTRAKFCADHLKKASQAFASKRFKNALDEYQRVLESNPKDSFVISQIVKCRSIIDKMNLGKAPNANSNGLGPISEVNENGDPALNNRRSDASVKQEKSKIVTVNTILPKKIKGQMRLCGIPTTAVQFQLESAILGSESNNWVVSENNREVTRFTGNSFSLQPKKTTMYYLSPDNRPELNFSFTIEVVELPLKILTIDGPSQLCSGQPFKLTLNGLTDEMKIKWQWYRTDGVNSSYRKSMGAGTSIRDSIQTAFTYIVTTEFEGCPLPAKISHQVNIFNDPSIPEPKYEFLNSKKDKILLTVQHNTDLDNDYQWSKNQFNTIYANGDSVSNYRLKKGKNTFYLRYNDECGLTSPTASISIMGKKRSYFFLNAGINGVNFPGNMSYNLTFGTKSWYLRSKTSLPFIVGNKFQTTLGSTSLQISDKSRVLNYPRSTGTYYIVNGNAVVSRFSTTTGFMFGTPIIRFFVGGGYGKAVKLWGLDIHNYSGNYKEQELWAKNTDQSAIGPEVEVGVFLKLGIFNIMGGTSMIIDSKIVKPYRDFQLGIGFNIK